jgi:hypothetical protein
MENKENQEMSKLCEILEKQRATVRPILGEQVLKILNESGIHNVHLELDGSLTGTYSTVEGLPVYKTIKNLRIEIDQNGKKIVINGDAGESTVDIGKVI